VFDVAFQLSFAATLGLILLARPISLAIQGAFERALPLRPHPALADALAVTTAATLATLPITAATFGTISLVALPANLLAVPLFTVVLATSAATVGIGLVSDALATVASSVTYLPLAAMVGLAGRFSDLSFAAAEVQGVGAIEAAVAYAFICAAGLAVRYRRQSTSLSEDAPFKLSPVLAPGLVTLAAALTWWSFLLPEPDTLRVTVLDVGQGDAILIETPSGERVLEDGGPSGQAVINALSDVLPRHVDRIDLVLLTHPQEDHVAGLPAVFDRFDIRAAAANGKPASIASYQAWRSAVAEEGLQLGVLSAGQVARLGEVTVEVLAPPPAQLTDTGDDVNNNSIVLRVTFRSVSFLLTGDL
jgi:competence protein ComEC